MSFLTYLRSGAGHSPKPSKRAGGAGDAEALDGELSAGPSPRPSSPRVVSSEGSPAGQGAADAEEALQAPAERSQSADTIVEAAKAPPVRSQSMDTVLEGAQEDSWAKLARDLQQEVQARTADVAALRTEASSQHALLSRLAEQVLAGAMTAGCAKRDDLLIMQQQLELQAAALREGLMDIQQQRAETQQQRAALVALAERLDQLSADEALQVGLKAGAGETALLELRREVGEVRDAVGSFRGVFAGQVEELRRELQVRRGRAGGGLDEILPTREECAMGRGISEDSEGPAEKRLQQALRKELAEELGSMERRFKDVSEGLETERWQRRAELEELRGLLREGADAALERAAEAVLRDLKHDISEEQGKMRGEQQAYAQELAAAGAQRAEQLEHKLLSLHAKLEESTVSRPEFVKLFDEVRGAKGEASLRLADGAIVDSSCIRGKLEELEVSQSELRRCMLELQDLKTESPGSNERSLKLELERVACLVDASPWTIAQEEAAKSLGDVAVLRGELSKLYEHMEAAEAREKALRSELSTCMQLGQDAAAKLPALAEKLETLGAPQPPRQQQQAQKPAARPADAPAPVRPASTTTTAASLRFPAKVGPLTVAPSVQLPTTQAGVVFPAAAQSLAGQRGLSLASQAARPEAAGLLQLGSTLRGSPHSVPAAMHGLTEAARPLEPGAPRRKALVVACSYFSSQVPLRGTLNDAWNILSLLRHTLQYAEDCVRFLLDGSEFCKVGLGNGPTMANIAEGLEWLTADAQPGDDLFFYFGGYGTQQPVGPQGDLCEAFLLPSDFAEGASGAGGASAAGHRLLPLADVSRALAALPSSCRVTMILDCAFSLAPGLAPVGGSPQPAAFARVSLGPLPPAQAGSDDASAFSPRTRYLDLPPISGQPFRAASSTQGVPEPSCVVHCFSACQHPQRCVELPIEGIVQGAFTWAWVKALISVRCETHATQLCSALKGIVAELRDHFQWLDQTPVLQLSGAVRAREGQREEAPARALKLPVMPLPANHRRRKALLVGINYSDSNVGHAQLKGCLNDAWNMHSILRRTLQFSEDQIRVLVDGEHGVQPKAACVPTRANIVAGLQWLVSGAQPGDCLVFLFCGYGAQHPRAPGSEEHEAFLVPSDFAADAPEDVLAQTRQDGSAPASPVPSHTPSPVGTVPGRGAAEGGGYRLVPLLEVSRLLAQLPARSSITMVLDCAYPAVPGLNPALTPSFPRVVRGRVDYRKFRDFVSRPRFLELPPLPVQHTPDQLRTLAPLECLVHCFSACRLEEWGCELPLEGTVQGAFTWALTKALAAGHFKSSAGTLAEALQRITVDLKQHFQGLAQTPVLLLSRGASGKNSVLGS